MLSRFAGLGLILRTSGVLIRLLEPRIRAVVTILPNPIFLGIFPASLRRRCFCGAATLPLYTEVMNLDAEIPRAFLKAGCERILLLESRTIGTEVVYRLRGVEKWDLIISDESSAKANLLKLRKLTTILVAS